MMETKAGLGVIDGNNIGYFDCIFRKIYMMDVVSFDIGQNVLRCGGVKGQCAPSHFEVVVQNLVGK